MKNFSYLMITGLIGMVLVLSGCKDSGTVIKLDPSRCEQPGRQVADGDIPTPEDLALDVYCAEQVIKRNAPNGVVTIFGSARAKEGMTSYDQTRTFANIWTKKMGAKYPILTGGGPGIMEAGNRGAKEAEGKSLYYATYFGSGAEKTNQYTTDGYMFASFSQREADMVDRAAAIVIAPGGVGTEWEIFETLAKIQTKKKANVPVVLLGSKKMWQPLFDRLSYLAKIKTISLDDLDILQVAETPEEAVALIEKGLKP